MLTQRENYLRVLRHQTPEYTPVFFTATCSCGFGAGIGPWFEKGPAGGGYDGFGVRWGVTDTGGGMPTPAPGSAILDDVNDWESKVKFPDLEAFDWAGTARRELKNFDPEQNVVDYGCGNGIFERLLALQGSTNALCTMADEEAEEAVTALFSALTDYKIKIAEKARQYYRAEVFTNYDDIASASNLFFSPETYRRLVKPHHKRLNEAVLDLGMIPIYHCCGRAEMLAEDFIETRAAAWTSVQPCNDIPAVCARYGGRLAVMGGLDVKGVTEEDIRREARRCMDAYGKYDCYVLFGPVLVDSSDPARLGAAMAPLIDEAMKHSAKHRA